MTKQLPTLAECYTIRDRAEANELVDGLRAAGYLAHVDHSGTCHTGDDGQHYHPSGVVVKLTPDQAAKLGKPTPKPDPARCYHEFCTMPATVELTDYGQGESGPFDPRRPVYEWRGVWGYCKRHAPR